MTRLSFSARVLMLLATGALLTLHPSIPSAEAPAQPSPRPRVVLIANNSGTETTDLLVPFAILKDAGVADVRIVAVTAGAVTLMPGLIILPDATVADVSGTPDVVVVPAMHDPTSPPLLAAVRRWANAGALVVSICDGAWVLAHAGLLEGRTATSHWYSIPGLRNAYPHTTWRQDARWVRDGRVITSAGVSASVPVARHLVELLQHGGIHDDDHSVGPPHDGARFVIHAGDVAIGARNYLLPWRREVVAVPLSEGIDELALGLALDLLDRTYAVRTTTFAPTPVRGRRGLRLMPDVTTATSPPANRTAAVTSADFDSLLADIEQRYGTATRNLVALQIEYSAQRD